MNVHQLLQLGDRQELPCTTNNPFIIDGIVAGGLGYPFNLVFSYQTLHTYTVLIGVTLFGPS